MPELHFIAWKEVRLHGRGFGKKLAYAILRAKESGSKAVIATVDCDNAQPRSRLRQLSDARELDRAKNPPFPTALGEANPHLEAWLLDDNVAVRRAIQLPTDIAIPNCKDVASPKDALNDIVRKQEASQLSYVEALGMIAACVDPKRCVHAKDTGFAAFVDDVRHELAAQI